MKSKILLRNLAEVLGEVDSSVMCIAAIPMCGSKCNTCPFLNSATLDEAIKELKNLLDKEVERGV